jgi:hypothetical protein
MKQRHVPQREELTAVATKKVALSFLLLVTVPEVLSAFLTYAIGFLLTETEDMSSRARTRCLWSS